MADEKQWKVEARYGTYRAACGHDARGTVEVAYGARSEAREAEFEFGWALLREEDCPACQRGEDPIECASAPPASERPGAPDASTGTIEPSPSLLAINPGTWAKRPTRSKR